MALPWSTIDMDFMNLNQAAHGDREFGYIQTRLGVARKTVAGHVERPVVGRAGRGLGPGRARARTSCGTLRLARFGDNMRDVAVTEGDKVEAQLRFGVSVNTYGVNDLVAVVDAVADADVDELVAEYDDTYARRARAAARRRAARVAALRRPDRAGPARVPRPTGGFGAFTTNFEDLGGLRQLPGLAVQRLMADGYGFGGEGDWKTSVLLRAHQGDGDRPARRHLLHGGLHLPPRSRARRRSSARTCSRSARRIAAAAARRCEIHPLGIGGREDPVRLVFTADPGPGRRRRHLATWATGSG